MRARFHMLLLFSFLKGRLGTEEVENGLFGKKILFSFLKGRLGTQNDSKVLGSG